MQRVMGSFRRKSVSMPAQNTVKFSVRLSRHILASLRYSTIRPPALTEPVLARGFGYCRKEREREKEGGSVGNVANSQRSG